MDCGYRRRLLSRHALSVHSALFHLPRLDRLQELSWFAASVDSVVLGSCFVALGSTLHKLTIQLVPTRLAIQARASIMSHIACLRSLRVLTIIPFVSGGAAAAPHVSHFASADRVDFSGLPQLKLFSEFTFRAVEPGFFFPSPEQCACLARCDALTTLDCGRWDAPEPGSLDELGQPFVIDTEEAFLAQRIGVLAASKARTIFEDSVVADAIDQEVRVRVCALIRLQMVSIACITPLVWSHLSQFVELRVLNPPSWSPLLTEADWFRLGKMTRVEDLVISGPDLLVARVIPSLLLCCKLARLVIGLIRLEGDTWPTLIPSLPSLVGLGLVFTCVSSLTSLHNSAITKLTLDSLENEHGDFVCDRRMLSGVSASARAAHHHGS